MNKKNYSKLKNVDFYFPLRFRKNILSFKYNASKDKIKYSNAKNRCSFPSHHSKVPTKVSHYELNVPPLQHHSRHWFTAQTQLLMPLRYLNKHNYSRQLNT